MRTRVVEPEWLDRLPAEDRRAIRSRQDLRRINTWMGNHRSVARALYESFSGQPPRRIFDLGAGDGSFLWGVARRLESWRTPGAASLNHRGSIPRAAGLKSPQAAAFPGDSATSAVLVDQREQLRPEVEQRFAELNWTVQAVTADVFHFCENGAGTADAIVANLFLHHFTDDELKQLFRLVSAKTRVLVSLEPRRSRLALFASRRLWLIGCNSVTRHDAVVSVRAGFTRRELTCLWPTVPGWELREGPAGMFGHRFVARRQA